MSKSKTDCVIALSFGQLSDKSKVDVNKEIAELASSLELPIITQKEVATYCSQTHTVVTNPKGYLNSWMVLTEAKHIMEREGYNKALLVAQAAHVKRVETYAAKLGINFVIPHDLPEHWDIYSQQWWTRSSVQWQIHEMLNVPKLKLLKRI